jgi:hypothetical protein
MLVHPGGATCLYNTLHQHYTWKSIIKDVTTYVKNCKSCQTGKRELCGYRNVPLKDVEMELWRDICIHLAGPRKAKIKNVSEPLIFHTLTIIDPFTSWVEIIPIYVKTAAHVQDLIKREWLY